MGVISLLLTAGCVSTSPDQRLQAIEQSVKAAGWTPLVLPSPQFNLMAYVPPLRAATPSSSVLRVYIEGDGLAWIDPQTPSFDPTPNHAVALELAMLDPMPGVVYLGRPCQYVRHDDRHGCESRWWTSHRFASEVMASTQAALNALKLRYQAQALELVGYSGGATVAAVMAAQRSDVQRLVTVAGNLDPAYWTQINRLTPLGPMQNPAEMTQALQRVPQVHFVGMQDSVIPPQVSEHFVSQFADVSQIKVVKIPGFDHPCCWAQAWPDLLKQAFVRQPKQAGKSHD